MVCVRFHFIYWAFLRSEGPDMTIGLLSVDNQDLSEYYLK